MKNGKNFFLFLFVLTYVSLNAGSCVSTGRLKKATISRKRSGIIDIMSRFGSEAVMTLVTLSTGVEALRFQVNLVHNELIRLLIENPDVIRELYKYCKQFKDEGIEGSLSESAEKELQNLYECTDVEQINIEAPICNLVLSLVFIDDERESISILNL